ncbi:MAG: pseudouridine-5'-phosphate glycosidase [Phycisphaerales bacterium]|nr:pseudouridine-5'-phosphate glycosidase [Phycisphaerales bacterium]
MLNRSQPNSLALESTLLLHGVPPDSAKPLANELNAIARSHNAHPTLIAVINGTPTIGLTDEELDLLLAAPQNGKPVPKANTANLGILIHNRSHAATTVSTTAELAAAAGIRVFATGGLGGAHHNFGTHWDVSSDLTALARFPLAIVTSGTKSILDVPSTREMLETLGIPVIGFQTDTFPAFYLRDSEAKVDARFDDIPSLARFIAAELTRTNRGIVIANPIPLPDELPRQAWTQWLNAAQAQVASEAPSGRDVTPRLLHHLHQLSGGATLRANLALIRSNTALGAQLAAHLAPPLSRQ